MVIFAPPETPYKPSVIIEITLNSEADLTNAKIHFNAYDCTENTGINFSPYSHDLTFVIPEPVTVFMITFSLLALTFYDYKHKKN